ncbi:hypothetical protein TraAM80_02184 [Trypanosoma rangeli]|uniref:FHA domain-containing protein n=1 Tax=Trypanosoma rangeli TaxID=5698 RepID=A0A3R7KTI0_TRYRA|nr:uncharacterized protein TraAM80_02184 [Trypanosoma rangeli]RNF09388.1 hypothetical protein TraAM80_02184 [Trypanosoma rangeli]|eukprot:RNF09388.1 hypothetical protein TraAM80_02184 [Trypanosoma rangeli]
MAHYFLRDAASGKRELLRPGKNVIGRSAAVSAVEGVSFVNVESPFATISRVQAVIEVAGNGDVWVTDCNSTNGTFLAVNAGHGIRLEPQRFYQLKPGNRVILGDVEMCLEAVASTTGDAYELKSVATPLSAPLSSNASYPTNLSGTHSEILCASTDTRAATTAAIHSLVERPSESAETGAKGTDLGSSHECAPDERLDEGVGLPPHLETSSTPGRKRHRTQHDITSPGVAVKSTCSPRRVQWVCFSGMDGTEKARAQKLAKKLGWQTTDKVIDAELLVVGSPVARTPKFLVAVGRGIPVATENFLENGDTAQLEKYVPALSHGSHTYSAVSLRKVIFRTCKTPIMQGMSFYLGALPQKVRGVAREIILGCGGEIARNPSNGARALTEESLDNIYDCVLRGCTL